MSMTHYTSAQSQDPRWCVAGHNPDRRGRDVEHHAIPAVFTVKDTDTVVSIGAMRFDEYTAAGDVVDLALSVRLELHDECNGLPDGGENHAFTRMSIEGAADLVRALQAAIATATAERERIEQSATASTIDVSVVEGQA